MTPLKAHRYTAPLKPRCYTASLKARCYIAIFLQNPTNPKYYFGTYFTKPKYYFGTILQSPNLFWQLFNKAQNTILAKTITLCSKPKTISWQNIY